MRMLRDFGFRISDFVVSAQSNDFGLRRERSVERFRIPHIHWDSVIWKSRFFFGTYLRWVGVVCLTGFLSVMWMGPLYPSRLRGAMADEGTGTALDHRAQYKAPEDDLYRSPIQVALSGDGKRLYVTCEGTNTLMVVDPKRGTVIGEVRVGEHPYGVALSPDGLLLYVTNRWSDEVSVVDTQNLNVIHTIPVGDDPHGLLLDRPGKTLYVANTSSNTISLFSTETYTEIKRLQGGVGPFEMVLSPDGKALYVSNVYSNPVPFYSPPVPEITVIDTELQIVIERRGIPSANICQEIALSPDGAFAVVAMELPKNLIPETQIYQGWMSTFGLGILETEPGGRTAEIVLDEMNLYFADPFGVVYAPDGRTLYVSSSAVDAVSVVDVDAVMKLLNVQDGRIGASEEEIARYARHLGVSADYVVQRIPTGRNPKGMALSPDGKRLYVANRLSDSITVIDTRHRRPVGTIELNGPTVETLLRRGEVLFHSSTISFQRQMSCNTCHPEGHLDRINYDIAADGMGQNLVDNRTLRGIAHTYPFKWNGKNPDLFRQEGPRAAQLFFRSHGYPPEDLQAVVAYVESIPVPPNGHRRSPLTPAQQRGKMIFERTVDHTGQRIPVMNRCITCHPPPYYTNRQAFDVGTKGPHDTQGSFDTPQLNNIYDGAPYLHDGRCYSLEEIWTIYNDEDRHGLTSDLTKQQLNDLIEYLKRL